MCEEMKRRWLRGRKGKESKGCREERAPEKENRRSTKKDWRLSQRGFEHFQEEFVHGHTRATSYHRPEATQRTIDLPDARHTQQQVLHLTRSTALPKQQHIH